MLGVKAGSPEVGQRGRARVSALVRGSGPDRECRFAEPWAEDYHGAPVAAPATPGVHGLMKAKRPKAAEEEGRRGVGRGAHLHATG